MSRLRKKHKRWLKDVGARDCEIREACRIEHDDTGGIRYDAIERGHTLELFLMLVEKPLSKQETTGHNAENANHDCNILLRLFYF